MVQLLKSFKLKVNGGPFFSNREFISLLCDLVSLSLHHHGGRVNNRAPGQAQRVEKNERGSGSPDTHNGRNPYMRVSLP